MKSDRRFEAKTRLARLLETVKRGESITIMRPTVARPVPIEASGRNVSETIAAMRVPQE